METFLLQLLGTNDVATYLAALFFALIGVAIVLLSKANKRNKHSENTPVTFSVKFLLLDNLREIILGFLLICLALRFSNEYAGTELTMWYALGVGLSLQKVAQWISKVEISARK